MKCMLSKLNITCEDIESSQIDYNGTIWEVYHSMEGNVYKKKTFGYDSTIRQWIEDTVFDADIANLISELVNNENQLLFIPNKWSVECWTNGIVNVSLHLNMIHIVDGKAVSVQEKEWSIECDFTHSKVQAWPIAMLRNKSEGGWIGAYTCEASAIFPDMHGAACVEIPTVVTETAISFMQEMAEEEFGFKPTYMGSIHGIEHMISFCMRPLDMNIYRFRHLVGQNYETLFPRDQCDNYRALCRFFHIDKPPKSLRKIYGEYPESFVAYLLFRQLGFTDINVIRRFFHREKLFGWRLMDMSYLPEQSRLSKALYLYEERIRWLERFCRWYLRHRSESALANYLRPLAVADEWEQDNIDILRMFIEAGVDIDDHVLHQETKRRLIREGFTREVHDLMMEELPGILPQRRDGLFNSVPKIPNVVIEYTKAERKYEDVIDCYQIVLPKDTNEICSYGEKFHNCVASYCGSVVNKRTLILAMKQGDKYIACLEIQQNRLIQALGPCNQHLSTEVGAVLCRWADSKKIAYKVRKK